MNSKQLKAAIDARAAMLAPQLKELDELRRQYDEAVSREWIAANNVTPDRLQRSDAKDLPWFGTVQEFARWMKESGCTAMWAEWNGRIYSTAELMSGRMSREAPGLAEHVAA